MPLLDSADPRPVHFVGIAGAGMSALAELFVRRGVKVTGCDVNPTMICAGWESTLARTIPRTSQAPAPSL